MMEVRSIGREANQPLLDLAAACVPRDRDGTVFHLDRSPDYFRWIGELGEEPTVLGVYRGAQLVATGSYVRRRVFWAGEHMPMYYVFDLKVHPDYRRGRAAYRLVRALQQRLTGRPTYSLMLEHNDAAMELVSGRAALRQYRRADLVRHFTWPLTLSPRLVRAYDVDATDPVGWTACCEQWASARNLVCTAPPTPRAGELRLVARAGHRALAIAMLVTDDPRRNMALRLGRRDRAARVALNVVGRITGAPPLPGPGSEYRRGFAAHLLYDPGDPRGPDAAMALLAHLRRELRRRGVPLLHLGLSVRDPLAARLGRRPDVSTFGVAVMVADVPDDPQARPTLVNFHEA